MALGIIMGISGDHSIYPAHAHLNLLGWVSLFLIGLFYRLHPALDASGIARIHVVVWIAGTIVLNIGVAAVYLGHTGFEFIAVVGSLAVLGAMIMFAFLVFGSERLLMRADKS